ncbi:MAG: hypothetical protein AAF193_02905, partial [Bacteroidota bacterium]
MAESSYIPITEGDLQKIREVVGTLIKEVKWTDPSKVSNTSSAEDYGSSILSRRKVFGGTGLNLGQAKVSLTGLAFELSKNSNLMNEDCNAVLSNQVPGRGL